MRFHAFLVVLLISRTCDNSLENHGRNEHHILFIFASMKFFFWWRWKMLFSHCFTVFYVFHMTLLHPPHPPPPFCKRQRNFQRNTIFQPSNIFQDSTSSNALHMTLLHPPSVYKNDLSGIASRLRVPRSSGEPPALSLYLYTHIIIYIHTYVYIYMYIEYIFGDFVRDVGNLFVFWKFWNNPKPHYEKPPKTKAWSSSGSMWWGEVFNIFGGCD